MPRYTYECNACGHQESKMVSYDDRDAPCEEMCGRCLSFAGHKRLIIMPAIGDPVRQGVTKPPKDFQKYVLDRINHSVPGAKIHTNTKEV